MQQTEPSVAAVAVCDDVVERRCDALESEALDRCQIFARDALMQRLCGRLGEIQRGNRSRIGESGARLFAASHLVEGRAAQQLQRRVGAPANECDQPLGRGRVGLGVGMKIGDREHAAPASQALLAFFADACGEVLERNSVQDQFRKHEQADVSCFVSFQRLHFVPRRFERRIASEHDARMDPTPGARSSGPRAEAERLDDFSGITQMHAQGLLVQRVTFETGGHAGQSPSARVQVAAGRAPDGTLFCAGMRTHVRAWLWVAFWLACGASAAHADESFYRYRHADGRVVYTNIAEQVPIEQRATAKLDLSRVALNTQIGNELALRFQAKHEQLTKTPHCQQLRAAANQDFLSRLWADFAPLVVCGGVLLCFLLFTPVALRRFGAPVWARTLMMAIPTLAVTGVVAFTMSHTNRSISALKQRAQPCMPDALERLAGAKNLLPHAKLIEQLEREIGRPGPVPGVGAASAPTFGLSERPR